jgi:hypothetical protein
MRAAAHELLVIQPRNESDVAIAVERELLEQLGERLAAMYALDPSVLRERGQRRVAART